VRRNKSDHVVGARELPIAHVKLPKNLTVTVTANANNVIKNRAYNTIAAK
jgi:hypothetical protein